MLRCIKQSSVYQDALRFTGTGNLTGPKKKTGGEIAESWQGMVLTCLAEAPIEKEM